MDLKKMFGHKYLVTLDESWEAETPGNRAEFLANGEQWRYYEIRGNVGTVYPFSETMVAVILPTRAARRLMKLMGAELVQLQHADDVMCFKADAKHAAAFVRLVKPKRLRALTEAHKAILSARLAVHRYKWNRTLTENSSSDSEKVPVLLRAERSALSNPPGNILEGRLF